MSFGVVGNMVVYCAGQVEIQVPLWFSGCMSTGVSAIETLLSIFFGGSSLAGSRMSVYLYLCAG